MKLLGRALILGVVLLVGMLSLDWWGNSRASGYDRICNSNLRQLSVAIGAYATDYDDTFPPADGWEGLLWPYVWNDAAFRCPRLPARGGSTRRSGQGYAYNENLAVRRRPDVPDDALLLFDARPGTSAGEDASAAEARHPREGARAPSRLVSALTGAQAPLDVYVVYANGHRGQVARPEEARWEAPEPDPPGQGDGG